MCLITLPPKGYKLPGESELTAVKSQSRPMVVPGSVFSLSRAVSAGRASSASVMSVFFLLTACGGGSGGGGVSPQTQLISFQAEYQAQPGLLSVSAATAYDEGHTGDAVRIGIVDSGLDGSHAEFQNNSFGGGDWQGDSDGLSDPHGHGSHVGGIAGSQRNQQGMHGIAPESHLYSYRILNTHGYFGNRTGAEMIPSVVSHATSHDVQILNNSWASSTEINDVSKNVIISALGAELDSWQDAVDDGHVMVWAAGNDRDSQVSVRSGLPYHFPSLQPGWLAVVSSGLSGSEPVYTNRCGLAQDWCLAAPGGDDFQAQNGILSVQTGGGYTRKSGTSMAAPHVAGGLALVMDAFPSLSAQQAAARLLETADYQGLTTAEGCTIDSCSEAAMKAVFGQGQMNINAALQPVSPLMIASAGSQFAVSHSYLLASQALYQPLRSALQGRSVLATDSFDGARFGVPAETFILRDDTKADAIFPPVLQNPLSGQTGAGDTGYPVSGGSGQSVSFITNSPAPQAGRMKATLLDLSQRSQGLWLISQHQNSPRSDLTLRIGLDEDRQSVSAHTSGNLGSDAVWIWGGAGLARHHFLADSQGMAGFATAPAQEVWMFGGVSVQLSDFDITAEMLAGQIHMNNAGGLLSAAELNMSSARLAVIRGFSSQLSGYVELRQPLYIHSGFIDVSDSGSHSHRLSLATEGRPSELSLGTEIMLTPQIEMRAALLEKQGQMTWRSATSEQIIGLSLSARF